MRYQLYQWPHILSIFILAYHITPTSSFFFLESGKIRNVEFLNFISVRSKCCKDFQCMTTICHLDSFPLEPLSLHQTADENSPALPFKLCRFYQIHYESDGKCKDVHLTEWKLNHVFLCALNLSHFTHDSTAFGSRVAMAIHRSAPNAMVSMCETFIRNESASGLINFSPALHNCSIAIFFSVPKVKN